jgi:hypothetical protein
MPDKIVRVVEAMIGETVRIRWFGDDGYYDQEVTCPPLETRKVKKEKKDERLNGIDSEENTFRETGNTSPVSTNEGR